MENDVALYIKKRVRYTYLLPLATLFTILVTVLVTVTSCTSIESDFLKVSQDLEASNHQIQKDTIEWAHKFAPIIADSNKLAFAGAYANTKSHTKFLNNHIDNLIGVIKELEPSDHKGPTEIMISQRNGDDLAYKIERYREQLLAMPIWNEEDKAYLHDSLPLNTFYNHDNARKLKKKNWSEYHFDHVPSVAVVALLNRFKNNALRSREMVWERIFQKATSNKSPDNP